MPKPRCLAVPAKLCVPTRLDQRYDLFGNGITPTGAADSDVLSRCSPPGCYPGSHTRMIIGGRELPTSPPTTDSDGSPYADHCDQRRRPQQPTRAMTRTNAIVLSHSKLHSSASACKFLYINMHKICINMQNYAVTP